MADELLRNVPPNNMEAERAVIGALLQDPTMVDLVGQEVEPDHFYKQSHATIYQAIVDLRNQGQPADIVVLASELKRRGVLEAVGGATELSELTGAVPTAANAVYYARLVRDRALLRATLNALAEAQREVFESRDRTEEILDRIEKRLFQITQKRVRAEAADIGAVLKETFARFERQQRGETVGIPYGFARLDEMTQGLHPGELVVVAARPSMGKCVAAGTEIVVADGSVVTIDDIVRRREASLLTLDRSLRLRFASPSAFVDDGRKPVFRVTTRLGRVIETTATHPFLTLDGWRPLGTLSPGTAVAVPRAIPVFGDRPLPEHEIKLLAYLIGDGGLTQDCPIFTNTDERLVSDFREAVSRMGGLAVSRTSRNDSRAPSWRVASDRSTLRARRRELGERLRARIPARGARSLARAIGVSPASITHWTRGETAPDARTFGRLCRALRVSPEALAPDGLDAIRKNAKNALTRRLEALGLWGKGAATKHVPTCIFTLPRRQLALFLNRLLATDGWISVLATGQVQAGYATTSPRLAKQVAHLLLRFGIVARVRRRAVRYRSGRRTSFQLDVTDARSLGLLLDEVGIFGKEEACERSRALLAERRTRARRDQVPVAVWETVAAAKAGESWSSLARRAGLSGTTNVHRDRDVSRERLERLAVALDSSAAAGECGRDVERLRSLATSDVLWDPIVSIEPLGRKQVYDLTVPGTHNFVAEDVCVHNTTFALNVLRNVCLGRPGAKGGHGAVFFSLEMPKEQLAANLLCSMAQVDTHKLRGGYVGRDEEKELYHWAEILGTQRIFIDDTPAITTMELRGKARRLRAEGKVDCIIIDYLQLMLGDWGSGQRARHEIVGEISRMLKALARELEVPVVALAQLNRNVEERPDHKPRMADLRESGAIEQDADVVMLLHRDEYYMSPEKAEAEGKNNVATLIVAKNRNGPTGDLDLQYQKEFSLFRELEREFRR